MIGVQRTAEREENAGRPLKELEAANALREVRELERYNALYDIKNFLDRGHYDFVLDTSHLTEDEVLDIILKEINERVEADV